MLHWALAGILVCLCANEALSEQCSFASESGKTAFRVEFNNATDLKIYLVDQGDVNPREILLLDNSYTSVLIGKGRTSFIEYFGNFNVTDYTSAKLSLSFSQVEFTSFVIGTVQQPKIENICTSITFRNLDSTQEVPGMVQLTVTFATTTDEGASLVIGDRTEEYDRVWIKFSSSQDEKIYGGGEQFSFFNMKGKSFPIWTREQGVGRNKATNITFMVDSNGGGGGDYHTTYWPQPLFYTDKMYSVGMTSSRYSVFDFSQDAFTEVEVWEEGEFQFDFHIGDTWEDIVAKTSNYLLGGKDRPQVPEWSYNGGAILGLQGGTETVMGIYNQAVNSGVKVSGIWIQDWVGQITTSFGTRLFWDWQLDENRYPDIRQIMENMEKEGVYFTAYINPYLNTEGQLYREADSFGYLVKITNGSNHVSDFGEFYCGTVDLTNPDAFEWYKQKIITNMIDVGFRGWMADFGEYMPIADQVFYDKRSPEELHNLWPSLWAQVNREAIEEAGMMGQIFVWMRAGHTDSAKYVISAWAGDQNVDWSIDDGLISTVPAALSLGMSGVGISHFDIGGFTSLYGVVRDQELLLRSAELAVFTPTMRTHEGNRPKDNWQIYSDDYTLNWFARLTRLHESLNNYTSSVIKEYYESNLPAQRPMFFECPTDYRCYDDQISKYQFMFGQDLLVAPIYSKGEGSRKVFFPAGSLWISIWDETDFVNTTIYRGDILSKNGRMGEPPVYYRSGSKYENIFATFQQMRAPQFTPNNANTVTNAAVMICVTLTAIFALWFNN